jgi:regulator of cell morphogenesis and NO signaling
MISSSSKMAEVIYLNHHLLSVIHKIGISLGFGDATVREVSLKNGLNPDFVVAILNTYNDPHYLPEEHLTTFSVEEIVNYLRRSHRAYILEQLPELANLFELYASETKSSSYNGLIRNFFSEYRSEMEKHFYAEDEYMFPYALAVEQSFEEDSFPVEMARKFKEYTITDFLQEHTNIEEKLDDLKNLIVKYVPQESDSILAFDILEKLFHLNNDLDDHSRIEEKVLIPKVVAMEEELKRRE